MDIPCEVKDCVSQEGVIDDRQEKMIRTRPSRKPEREKSEYDKWVDVYRIIFPDDNVIPNPCE